MQRGIEKALALISSLRLRIHKAAGTQGESEAIYSSNSKTSPNLTDKELIDLQIIQSARNKSIKILMSAINS